MDQDANWNRGRPQRRRHCVRQHVQIARRVEPSTVLWAFHIIQPSSFVCIDKLRSNINHNTISNFCLKDNRISVSIKDAIFHLDIIFHKRTA